MSLIKHIYDAGFPYTPSLIHVFVGGSELHGAKVQGTDDLDIYGLYVEHPTQVIGLFPYEHFVWSSSSNEQRNTAADVDITLYGLRKWAGMALKGNPTALHFLFAPSQMSRDWYNLVPALKKCVLARSATKQFKGFADAQLGRLLGTRGRGKKGQRPELEEKFGYDVKAGMHTIRLLNEAIELMHTGTITLPRPEKDMLIEIRTGQWTLDKLVNHANVLFAALNTAEEKSWLPEEPNRTTFSALITNAYMEYWRQHDLT